MINLKEFFDDLSKVELSVSAAAHFDDANAPDNVPTMRFFYRGQGSAKWPLLPSLFRDVDEKTDKTCAKVSDAAIEKRSYFMEEQFLMQEAERLFPADFATCKTDIDKLAVMQHNSIPTRLLDVSENALVALYFAVAAEPDEDGAVYAFRIDPAQYRDASTKGQEGLKVSVFHDPNVIYINAEIPQRPMLVLSPMLTRRQLAQSGAFMLFSNAVNPFKLNAAVEMSDYERIIIPKKHKKYLKRELERRCCIHRGTLFPESMADSREKLKGEARFRITHQEEI